MRSCFASVNSLENAHTELEEAGGQVHKWHKAERKCIANTQRLTREVENEKQRQAYLSFQSAQEAGEQAHIFEGLRGDVERARDIVQQAQRHDAVPHIDRIFTFAAALDAPGY